MGTKGLRSWDDDEFDGGSLGAKGSGQSLSSCIVSESSDTDPVHLNYLKPRLK